MWRLVRGPGGTYTWSTPEGAFASQCKDMLEAILYVNRMEELLGINIDWTYERA